MQPQLYYNYTLYNDIMSLSLNVLQHLYSIQNRRDILHILKVVYISDHVVATCLSIYMKICIMFIVIVTI